MCTIINCGENMKKGMATVWVVIITTVIALGIGGGYYYVENQNETEKLALQNQIDESDKKIEELERSLTALTLKSENAQEGDEDSSSENSVISSDYSEYSLARYGLSFEYPTSWESNDLSEATCVDCKIFELANYSLSDDDKWEDGNQYIYTEISHVANTTKTVDNWYSDTATHGCAELVSCDIADDCGYCDIEFQGDSTKKYKTYFFKNNSELYLYSIFSKNPVDNSIWIDAVHLAESMEFGS